MKTPISVRMDEPLFRRLHDHLFPGDEDEHAAVIVAGLAETDRGTRMLARDVVLARDGTDYVPGRYGYRALTARFVAEVAHSCAKQHLCYLAVHCHGGRDEVAFSKVDVASHERGYPALLDITEGGPVGALVLAQNAVAGDIWTPAGRSTLDFMTVVGPRVRTLYPCPQGRPPSADLVYDRHARLFGDAGQDILQRLKVGIVGLGGGGSLLSEWLARLGIGHIVAIDFDRIGITNLPRVVGATWLDALAPLARSRHRWLRELANRHARHKVQIARRVAKAARRPIRYDAIAGDIVDEPTARLLTDVDFMFLATDNIQSRLVFNALAQQYIIPGAQIGVKVTVDKESGQVGAILANTRPVLPYPGGGCLECHELLPADRLSEEALSDSERRRQQYVEEDTVVEPSVITLNALTAAQAANDLLMMFTGLYAEGVALRHYRNDVHDRTIRAIHPRQVVECLACGSSPRSRRGRGDRQRLPCRMEPRHPLH